MVLTQELIIDEEFRNIIPPLTFDERTGLEENIAQNGCLDPIKTWNGIIIDGHNRYDICTKYGLEFNVLELEFDSRDDAKLWIIRHQIDRRNINDYIRGRLALQFESIIQERAKANQQLAEGGDRKTDEAKENQGLENSPKVDNPINTRQELAKLAGVSDNTIARIKKIEEEATPEQKKELEDGTKSINKVFHEIKSHEPKFELPDDYVDTDYCACEVYIPKRNDVTVCPCGCGYGYCEANEKWYSNTEIQNLKD